MSALDLILGNTLAPEARLSLYLATRHLMALQAALRRVAGTPGGTTLLEERIGEGSKFAERTIAKAEWPPGTIVVSIQRGNQLHFPDPDAVLESGDMLSVLTHIESAESLRQELRGAAPPSREPEEPGPDLI